MIEGLATGDLAIDSLDPEGLRDFYAALTGWKSERLYDCPGLVTDTGLPVIFMYTDDYVSPAWPGSPAHQQKMFHFDFQVDDIPAAVDEVVRCGGSKPSQQFGGEHWVTMLDPEGHPFCLCQK